MKKILVPTDFSDCADLAVKAAIRLAKLHDAEIYFLHYMTIPIDWIERPANQEKVNPDINKKVDHVKAKLDNLVQRAGQEGVRALPSIGYNEDSDTILDHIDIHNIDLVVMGSHGARGFQEFFLGSNAQRVIRYANVPVLIIKKDLSIQEKSSIVFVSDFVDTAMHSFLKIMEFAKILDAKIHLLHINMPNNFEDTWAIKLRMESFIFAANTRLAKAEIIDAHNFEEGLARYCEDIGGGIVGMVTHGQNGMSRMYQESLTEKVVNHVDLPILSVRV